MRLLGIVDYMNTCDCCGRTDLKCTVAFDTDDGIVYYGRTCATSWYKKSTKEINTELKAIKKQAYQEADALWQLDSARIEYKNLLARLNDGPTMSFIERMEIVEPVSKRASERKKEIIAEVTKKYFLQPNDIYLY